MICIHHKVPKLQNHRLFGYTLVKAEENVPLLYLLQPDLIVKVTKLHQHVFLHFVSRSLNYYNIDRADQIFQ